MHTHPSMSVWCSRYHLHLRLTDAPNSLPDDDFHISSICRGANQLPEDDANRIPPIEADGNESRATDKSECSQDRRRYPSARPSPRKHPGETGTHDALIPSCPPQNARPLRRRPLYLLGGRTALPWRA